MADKPVPVGLKEALKNVITFQEPMMPGFATIRIEREIHDAGGNVIPAQLHFLDSDGVVYVMANLEKVADTKFNAHIEQYVTDSGNPFTFFDLLDLVCGDKTLASFINPVDMETISRSYNQQLPGQTTLFKEETPQKREISIPFIGTRDLLSQNFLPMLNGNPTNSLMRMSAKYLASDGITGVATFKNGDNIIRVKDFLDVAAHLGTSAKKLMDTSVAYLTNDNFYKGGTINPTAIIPLDEYWRAQRYPIDPVNDTPEEQARVENYIKWLKKNIRADCKALKQISWEGYTGTGKNQTQQAEYSFVSGWSFLRGNRLKINFDIDLATFLVYAYEMQFPVVLLALDNRKPNSYVIGRKIAFHHSMDNNAAVGTQNTISVKSLLAAAPEIPSYEVVTAKRQGGWKTRIKQKLEAALNDNITIGFLSKWEYRDSKAKAITRYTPETAETLCWDEYYSLMVDFTLKEEPDQEKRRAKRAAEKIAAMEKPLRKRGRLKKGEKRG